MLSSQKATSVEANGRVTKKFLVLVRDATQQENSNGVCSLPSPRKGKLIPEGTIKEVC